MIFGINTTSDISELFYIISRAARRVKFGAILRIESRVEFRNSRVTVNLPLSGTVSQVVFMPNITYNSCYYLFILQPEKFSHLTPCVYFRRVVLCRRENWF